MNTTKEMKPRVRFWRVTFPMIAVWTVPILVLVFGFFMYDSYQYKQAQAVQYTELQQHFEDQLLLQAQSNASTSASIRESLAIIEENLSLTKSESLALANTLEQTLNIEQQKISSLQRETAQIGGTVGNLEKLSQIDPELLMKYSKVFFLNEHYVPSSLSEILNKYLYSERVTKYFHANALHYLTQMLDDATTQGEALYVKSAYRSFNEQDNLKNGYSVIYGENTANSFSADQGYSEHQLGTTVDLITTGFDGILSTDFENTSEYTWLYNNGYKYGFILSYPKGNTYYVYEPWHWRFVGVELATKLHNEGKGFYDLDQRVIDEYLISLFD